MYRTKFLTRWKEFIFRLCRSEGALRGSMGLIGFGMIPILMFVKTKYYEPHFVEPKKIKDAENLQEIDQKARDTLLYNKFGAPTRPHRNMDDMMNFLSGSETYDDLFDFVSYPVASDINRDQSMGLDSIMSEVDQGMMKKYRESLKNKTGH